MFGICGVKAPPGNSATQQFCTHVGDRLGRERTMRRKCSRLFNTWVERPTA